MSRTCTAPAPESVEAALAARPESAGGEVQYREEIYHPALPAPRVATGSFRQGEDGALIRAQEIPEPETVEIGKDFLTITRAGGQPDLYPIPGEMAAMLALLRGLVSGDSADLLRDFDAVLSADVIGWQVILTPHANGASPITLIGCGAQAQAFEMTAPDGIRRRTILGSR